MLRLLCASDVDERTVQLDAIVFVTRAMMKGTTLASAKEKVLHPTSPLLWGEQMPPVIEDQAYFGGLFGGGPGPSSGPGGAAGGGGRPSTVGSRVSDGTAPSFRPGTSDTLGGRPFTADTARTDATGEFSASDWDGRPSTRGSMTSYATTPVNFSQSTFTHWGSHRPAQDPQLLRSDLSAFVFESRAQGSSFPLRALCDSLTG